MKNIKNKINFINLTLIKYYFYYNFKIFDKKA